MKFLEKLIKNTLIKTQQLCYIFLWNTFVFKGVLLPRYTTHQSNNIQ